MIPLMDNLVTFKNRNDTKVSKRVVTQVFRLNCTVGMQVVMSAEETVELIKDAFVTAGEVLRVHVG